MFGLSIRFAWLIKQKNDLLLSLDLEDMKAIIFYHSQCIRSERRRRTCVAIRASSFIEQMHYPPNKKMADELGSARHRCGQRASSSFYVEVFKIVLETMWLLHIQQTVQPKKLRLTTLYIVELEESKVYSRKKRMIYTRLCRWRKS